MANQKETSKPVVETTQAGEPKKKSHTTLIIVLVLLFIFVVMPFLTIFGVTWFVQKKIKDAGKNGINYNNGVIGFSTQENQKWPTGIPADIPPFTAGTIKSSGHLGTTWTLSVNGVKAADYSAYKAKLAAAGWLIEGENDLSGLNSYSAKKGNWTISPMFNPTESSLVLGITEFKPETTEQ